MTLKNKPALLLLMCFMMLITLNGCLGKIEINDLAMVMAVGIDKGDKAETVRVTVQIARPADTRGQTGAPSGQTGEPIYSASADGRTIFEAVRNLARYSSRRVFWAHNFIIVINEDFAREEGVQDIIDFFTRNYELRMRTWVVVTPEKASEMVSTQTGLEVIPGQSIDNLFRYSRIVAEAPRTDMKTFQAAYLSENTHPVLARVTLVDRGISNKKPQQYGTVKQVSLGGTGVFKRDKLIGVLSPRETKGLIWFVENVESRIVVLPCPTNPKKQASVELKNQKFNVTPFYHDDDGTIQYDVHLITYADMVELGCSTNLDNTEVLAQLEKDLEKKLTQEIVEVVQKAQHKYKVDFLELGKVFQNKYPAEWKQARKNWEREFSKAQVKVKVEAHLYSPVLLQKPTRSGK